MKRRILPMLALFASLTLASCGGNTKKSSSSPAPESSSAPISSVEPASSSVEEITSSVPEESSVEPQQEWTNNATYHWHLVDGKQEDKAKHDMQEVAPEDDNNVPEGGNKAKAATCAEPGVKVEICSVCGYRKESNLKQLDHEYPNDGAYEETKPATCAEAGTKERTCSVCGEKDEQSIAKLAHNWEEKSTVEASGEGVGYTVVECSICHTQGILVAAANATTSATPKSAPEGCIKLNADNDYMTIKFNVSGAKTGTLYQRGRMDYWYEESNNNQNRTYFSANNGHTNESTGVGNFKVEYGASLDALTEISIADKVGVTYGSMLPEEGAITFSSHQWSDIGDCEIGAISLVDGLNVIKYTRIDSFNLAVHDFFIVFDAAE